MNVLIVGAGLAGLSFARALRLARPNWRLTLSEKSRGVGGRMATRRSEAGRFDHGAQFYSLREPLAELHRDWTAAGLVKPYFQGESAEAFCAKSGMTALAKRLAEGLDVRLETRVKRLSSGLDGRLSAECDLGSLQGALQDSDASFDRVALACPLPQSLEIVRASGWEIPGGLEKIRYAKALVALVEWDRIPPEELPSHGYLELADSAGLQYVADQTAKGLASAPSWTVVASPEWSETRFDGDDERSLAELTALVERRFGPGQAKSAQLKKWRYSHPLSTHSGLFAETGPENRVLLFGDAFGGPSLNGAARSAQAACERALAWTSN